MPYVGNAKKITPRIYVACLASYNAGTLFGRWIDAEQASPEDIQADIDAMLKASPAPNAEEYAIHDHEGFTPLNISEWESLERIFWLATEIVDHGEAFALWCHYVADNGEHEPHELGEKFQEAFVTGPHETEADAAREYYEETLITDQPLPTWAEGHIDWDSVIREMETGDFTTARTSQGVYLFRRC